MAITRRGFQTREPIEETNYRIVKTWPDVIQGSVVLEYYDSYHDCAMRELWHRNDRFSGYVIVIDGVGYEFIRSLPNAK